uniref:Alpha-soluble NSF attachment protein n=1 Tax=Noctiluca scintillans TaxID=2966 RepID=A0A7S1FJB5_NOCSC
MAGANLVSQAEQKLKGGFLSFLSGGPKYDEAAELYVQAANQFKISKEWKEAANCYEQSAFCAQQSGSTTEQADCYNEAGNVLKKVSTQAAIEQYEKAIAIYSSNGRFSQSGKLLLAIAELTESERVARVAEVRSFYQRASEMFDLDDYSKSNYTKCILKVAEYAAKDGELEQAIQIFETEGEKALSSNLLQYGAKEHFLRAGILHLVMGDTVTINLALEKYKNIDPRFGGSRECELLEALSQAYEEREIDMFVEKLSEYDNMTKLDAWKTEFLVKVKDAMQPSMNGNAIDLS